jgi:hypothetical protein
MSIFINIFLTLSYNNLQLSRTLFSISDTNDLAKLNTFLCAGNKITDEGVAEFFSNK